MGFGNLNLFWSLKFYNQSYSVTNQILGKQRTPSMPSKPSAEFYAFSLRSLCVLLFLGVQSCGYNWGHYNRALPEGYKTVFVDVFDNKSQEPVAEILFTNAIIKELQRSGFVLVRDKSRAEVVLKGTVMTVAFAGLNSTTSFSDAQNQAFRSSLFTQYQVNIASNLKLYRAIDNKMLWQTTVRGGKTYFGPRLTNAGLRSSNPLYNQSARKRTMKVVAQEMMNEAFDRMTETF